MATKMPAQKPGKSEQIVVTPWSLIDAVEKRFGKITWDLAATCINVRVKPSTSYELYGNANACAHFGPGSTRGENSLAQDWRKLRGNLWLNPPYGKTKEAPHGIADWASKCCETNAPRSHGELNKIFLLVPAGVGSNWFAKFVYKKALVLLLQGRVTFEGHTQSYPKDLLLAVYGEKPGVEVWDWRRQR